VEEARRTNGGGRITHSSDHASASSRPTATIDARVLESASRKASSSTLPAKPDLIVRALPARASCSETVDRLLHTDIRPTHVRTRGWELFATVTPDLIRNTDAGGCWGKLDVVNLA